MGYKVVLTDHVFPEESLVSEVLAHVGAVLEVHETLVEDELCRITRDADAVLVERAHITARVVAGMERCRIIVRHGVGYDTLDVDAATEAGICVCNVTDYCTPEVADHAMAMLLALCRTLLPLDAEVRSGGWSVYAGGGKNRRIEGQTLGIVGFGKIGAALARRAAGFGLKLLGYDPYVGLDAMAAHGVKKVDLEELLRQSDMVSLHLPLSAQTRHILDAERIALMKPSAIVVNTSRGGLVDQRALYQALVEGRLAGAGLDVFEQEPPGIHKLFKLDNAVVTNHMGWYSEEAMRDLQRKTAEEAVRVLSGQPLLNWLNRW